MAEIIDNEKVPWLGIVAVIYGLIAHKIVPAISHFYHVVDSEEQFIKHIVIVILIAVSISHFSLYRILRNPYKYKWKAITFIAVLVSYGLLITCAFGIVIKPLRYEQQLKTVISETTCIRVSLIGVVNAEDYPDPDSIAENYSDSNTINEQEYSADSTKEIFNIGFEESDREVIQEIIENIKIAPFGYSLGGCLCAGNQNIEFYKGEKLCAKLTFHHGESLRWFKGMWKSDMILTNQSVAYIENWMTQYGMKNYD